MYKSQTVCLERISRTAKYVAELLFYQSARPYPRA